MSTLRVCGASWSSFCEDSLRSSFEFSVARSVKIPEIICVKINAHIATKDAFEPNLFSNAASHREDAFE